jgi:chromosomal replication initiator protein
MNDQSITHGFSVPLRAVVNVTSLDAPFSIVAAPMRPVYRHVVPITTRLINEAEKLWGIPAGSIKSPTRYREVTYPRFAVIYAARRMTRPQRSYPEIGRIIGGRDHSTIISGERRAKELRYTDPEFRSMLACLMINVWRARRVAG